MEGNPLVGKPMEEDRGRVDILEAEMGSELVCNRRVVGRVGVGMQREGMADLGGARRVDIQLREDMVALGGEVGVYIQQQVGIPGQGGAEGVYTERSQDVAGTQRWEDMVGQAGTSPELVALSSFLLVRTFRPFCLAQSCAVSVA